MPVAQLFPKFDMYDQGLLVILFGQYVSIVLERFGSSDAGFLLISHRNRDS